MEAAPPPAGPAAAPCGSPGAPGRRPAARSSGWPTPAGRHAEIPSGALESAKGIVGEEATKLGAGLVPMMLFPLNSL